MSILLTVTAQPTAHELATIGEGLATFNHADAGPANRLSLAVVVRADSGSIVGGLSGYTGWGWLYVQWLWLDETRRGAGLGGRMLDAAEAEAKNRGCRGAYIDTFNPIALKLYQRHGYVPFGTLPDFPPGRTRTFLQKPL
ncbi:MAG: family N-acetyltransferase [Devosia sp.]|jgi:GNAT superfamily N-acetyltransferase|nr:family N-acetyltransferase [Devosia sp.]